MEESGCAQLTYSPWHAAAPARSPWKSATRRREAVPGLPPWKPVAASAWGRRHLGEVRATRGGTPAAPRARAWGRRWGGHVLHCPAQRRNSTDRRTCSRTGHGLQCCSGPGARRLTPAGGASAAAQTSCPSSPSPFPRLRGSQASAPSGALAVPASAVAVARQGQAALLGAAGAPCSARHSVWRRVRGDTSTTPASAARLRNAPCRRAPAESPGQTRGRPLPALPRASPGSGARPGVPAHSPAPSSWYAPGSPWGLQGSREGRGAVADEPQGLAGAPEQRHQRAGGARGRPSPAHGAWRLLPRHPLPAWGPCLRLLLWAAPIPRRLLPLPLLSSVLGLGFLPWICVTSQGTLRAGPLPLGGS